MKRNEMSFIDKDAKIGTNVKIGQFTVIEPDVVIGDNTEVGSNVLLASGTRIGADCKIFHGAAIGSVPQDLKFEGEYTTVEIGDRTVIREYCTINRATKDKYKTVVGSDCLLMSYTHVAHDCTLGNNVILANSVNMAGHVLIDDWAIIGGLVPIHQFVRIGKHSFIGGGFRVDKDVPPYVLAAGQPLKYTGLNSLGLRRRNFGRDKIGKIKSAYKIIYFNDMNTTQAIEHIRKNEDMIPEIEEIIGFIEDSKRGII
ncbi:acyl-ACP--UDP-N-acetylglucosamine O-acyltransferase [candidate division KSB1 bacterium]